MNKFIFLDFAGDAPLAGVLEGEKAYFFKSSTRDGICLLAKVLTKAGKKPKGIIAVTGPGSFSAVRGTVVAANMLSELLGAPICGVRREENESAKSLAKRGLAAFMSGKSVKLISPHYYAEPNITKPKLGRSRELI